jgi:DNA-binding response OmpR family regulator
MATAAEILVVEDEPELRGMVAEYLARHGFAVRMAIDGEAMAARLLERAADLVILDINMPGEDGLTLARRLREHSDTCIMMLTAAGTTVDRVVGLEILHCEAIRSARAPRPRAHRIAPPGRCRVASRPAQSAARYPPSRTLAARCRRPQADWRGRSGTPPYCHGARSAACHPRHPNRLLSRDQLLELAHRRDWEPFDRSIDIRVTRLRKKIERDPAKPEIIKTIRGTGYMYVSDTR